MSGDLLNKYQNSYGRKLKNSDENSGSENGSDVCLSKEEIRAKIVEEIVSTEEDYVQNLKDIVEVNHNYVLSILRLWCMASILRDILVKSQSHLPSEL